MVGGYPLNPIVIPEQVQETAAGTQSPRMTKVVKIRMDESAVNSKFGRFSLQFGCQPEPLNNTLHLRSQMISLSSHGLDKVESSSFDFYYFRHSSRLCPTWCFCYIVLYIYYNSNVINKMDNRNTIYCCELCMLRISPCRTSGSIHDHYWSNKLSSACSHQIYRSILN